jgi:hypothetical protein
MSITISADLKSLIPPLTPEEYAQLEANLRRDGCLNPLVVWQEEQILLDGHHRLQICEQHGLDYRIQEIALPDVPEAKLWMLRNQRGRRNSTPDQLSYMRGMEYNLLKQQGRRTDLTSRQSGEKFTSSAATLAAVHQVGARTIERDGVYADAVETLVAVLGPDSRQPFQSGDLRLTRQDVQLLAALVEANPEIAPQVTAALQGATPADELRTILAAARCAICHRPMWDPASVSRGIGPVCAGHGNGTHGSRDGGSGPPTLVRVTEDGWTSYEPLPTEPLVLDPEAPEADETTASTLTERERAYFGPRTDKEPGTVPWCWQTIGLMQSRWKQKTSDEAGLRALLEEVQAHEAWNVVPSDQPYGSLARLVATELGLDLGYFLQDACRALRDLQTVLVESASTAPSERTDAGTSVLDQCQALREAYREVEQVLRQAFPAVEPPGGAPASPAAPPEPDCPPFDTTIFVLGKLCRAQHEWGSTGQTRLRIKGRYCPECNRALKRQTRQQQKQA